MVQESYEGGIERLENMLNGETPLVRKEVHAYSTVMKKVFPKVEHFHRKGFSFVQICAACEKSGLLPAHSNPSCFRQAFRRERSRLERENAMAEAFKNDREPEEKQMLSSTNVKEKPSVKSPEREKTASDEETERRERIRKMTSVEVDTGLGKIVKHADGSFEF